MKKICTYKFKLYNSKRNRHLDHTLSLAWEIWNHSIALHRRYYRLYGKHLNKYKLQKHYTRLMKTPKYAHWHGLGSQAIQDITDRIERSYQAFFNHLKGKTSGKKSVPHFKKYDSYRSITLKQAGHKFIEGTNRIVLMGRTYKYFKSREIEGKVKTLTIKRNTLGEYFIFATCEVEVSEVLARTGEAVGMDFGLKDFLVLSNGDRIESPLWMKQNLKSVKTAHRKVSKCEKGSGNRKRAIQSLDRIYTHMSDSRTDWFFKLANELTAKYAVIRIEDLNLDGMKRLWGRKVSDLAFAEFVEILEYVAYRNGCIVEKVPRFFASSKTCHECGCINESLSLKDRMWICPSCGAELDRDWNAAINIRDYQFA